MNDISSSRAALDTSLDMWHYLSSTFTVPQRSEQLLHYKYTICHSTNRKVQFLMNGGHRKKMPQNIVNFWGIAEKTVETKKAPFFVEEKIHALIANCWPAFYSFTSHYT